MQGSISKSIEWLDHLAMDLIEQVGMSVIPVRLLGCSVHVTILAQSARLRLVCLQGDAAGFAAYLEHYGNTICGRHPIGVLLHVSTRSSWFCTDGMCAKNVSMLASSVINACIAVCFCVNSYPLPLAGHHHLAVLHKVSWVKIL